MRGYALAFLAGVVAGVAAVAALLELLAADTPDERAARGGGA